MVKSGKNQDAPAANGPAPWSLTRRIVASGMIVAFLFVVIMGPVTNPIATEEFTAPIARTLAPLHQMLFLGHGYRFFAPDPGPSHRLLVRTSIDADNRFAFPDRNENWPRLMYHRWFMLSESVWAEYQTMPDQASFDAMQKELETQAGRYREAGKAWLARSMRAIRDRRAEEWSRGMERIGKLTASISREMEQRAGEPIQLYLQERAIPLQADVILGDRLDDPRFLSPPVKIGGPEGIVQ